MKKNKKIILGLITVALVCLLALGITYAYWILTREQTGENVVNTACLNISFTGENDIQLDKAYPLKPEELEKFLSTATPYHFTIHNECSDLASASINLESLTVDGKALEDEYIDVILYEEDYDSNLNNYKKLTENTPNDDNKVITDSKHSYSLYNFTLKANEERNFNLLLYMDSETPMEDTNMNASWEGKVTLSAGYKEDSRTIRQIQYTDTQGMWGYKDKLTRIVIEDTKSLKQAPEGGKVYGSFDESEYGTKVVESYVVCEADDTNCVGYLQSDGKLKANPDSSYLFASFPNVTEIIGLEKLDVSKVSIMRAMFMNSGLASVDLSMWNTSNVINVNAILQACNNLKEVNISNWDLSNISGSVTIFGGNPKLETINMTNVIFQKDCISMFVGLSSVKHIILDNADTSHVTNMFGMFANLSGLEELDLSSFDTTNVTTMEGMFDGCSQLETLNLSNFSTVNVKNFSRIFSGCRNLLDLDLSNWDLSNLNSVALLTGLSKLQTLNMTNFVFPTNSSNFFYGISNIDGINNLSKIVLYNADTSHVTSMYGMFAGCSNLQSLDLSDFDTTNVTNITGMFSGCSSLQSLDLSNFVFPENIRGLFASGLSKLNNIIFDNVDTSKVIDMSGMFSGCSSLSSLDLSSWNTSNVTNYNDMFAGTSSLQSITFGPKFVHKPEASTLSMFSGCPAPERPTDDSWSEVSF